MDTARLKRKSDPGSHSGAAWTRRWLYHGGTVEDVRREVRRRIDDFAGDGGYVLCAVHNIQSEVPPENVVAMFEAALEHGSDPSGAGTSTKSLKGGGGSRHSPEQL